MFPVYGRKSWVHAMCVKWIAGAMLVGTAVHIAEPAKAQQEELFCLCQKPYQDGTLMIGCDDCNGWFHPECIGMSKEQAEAVTFYQCPNCSLDGSKVETNHNAHAESDQLLPATKKQKVEEVLSDVAAPLKKKQKLKEDLCDDDFSEFIDSDGDEEV